MFPEQDWNELREPLHATTGLTEEDGVNAGQDGLDGEELDDSNGSVEERFELTGALGLWAVGRRRADDDDEFDDDDPDDEDDDDFDDDLDDDFDDDVDEDEDEDDDT